MLPAGHPQGAAAAGESCELDPTFPTPMTPRTGRDPDPREPGPHPHSPWGSRHQPENDFICKKEEATSGGKAEFTQFPSPAAL